MHQKFLIWHLFSGLTTKYGGVFLPRGLSILMWWKWSCARVVERKNSWISIPPSSLQLISTPSLGGGLLFAQKSSFSVVFSAHIEYFASYVGATFSSHDSTWKRAIALNLDQIEDIFWSWLRNARMFLKICALSDRVQKRYTSDHTFSLYRSDPVLFQPHFVRVVDRRSKIRATHRASIVATKHIHESSNIGIVRQSKT